MRSRLKGCSDSCFNVSADKTSLSLFSNRFGKTPLKIDSCFDLNSNKSLYYDHDISADCIFLSMQDNDSVNHFESLWR